MGGRSSLLSAAESESVQVEVMATDSMAGRPSDTKLVPSRSEPVEALHVVDRLGDHRRFAWRSMRFGHSSEVGVFACSRYGHTMEVVGGRMYVIGGHPMLMTYLCYLDLIALEWHDLTQRDEGPRDTRNHCSTVVNDCIYVWGGDLLEGHTSSVIWKYDLCTNEWTACNSSGEMHRGRRFLSFEFVEARSEIILFGGEMLDSHCTRLSAYRVDSGLWYQPVAKGEAPVDLLRHGTCVVGSTIYIFGGYDARQTGATNDLVLLHCAGQLAWSRPKIYGNIPPGRLNPSFCNCGGKIVLCGGFGEEYYQDTWLFSVTKRKWVEVVADPNNELLNEEYTMVGECPKGWLNAAAYGNNTLYLVGNHFVTGDSRYFYYMSGQK